MNKNNYDKKYESKDYYWGTEPSKTCRMFLEQIKFKEPLRPTLIDIGCGEGRNTVSFAENGFIVTGMDSSLNGLKKTKLLAHERNVKVDTIENNINDFTLHKFYDVIFSTGTLHYLRPDIKPERFSHFKQNTNPGGYNVFSVFVEKPFIDKAPDAENNIFLFRSGELLTYYRDWEILFFKEEIFDCNSGGTPHRHAVNRLIAKKV